MDLSFDVGLWGSLILIVGALVVGIIVAVAARFLTGGTYLGEAS